LRGVGGWRANEHDLKVRKAERCWQTGGAREERRRLWEIVLLGKERFNSSRLRGRGQAKSEGRD